MGVAFQQWSNVKNSGREVMDRLVQLVGDDVFWDQDILMDGEEEDFADQLQGKMPQFGTLALAPFPLTVRYDPI